MSELTYYLILLCSLFYILGGVVTCLFLEITEHKSWKQTAIYSTVWPFIAAILIIWRFDTRDKGDSWWC